MGITACFRIVLTVGVLLAACATASAQEIRMVGGEKHIAHTVLKGQTLYALSKHYAVPIDAILAANPAAAQGLSLGQVLLLPVKAQQKKELKTAPALMESELGHTVRKKETLFGIARQYGVDQSDLVARNPAIGASLKEGMVIVIPVARIANVPAAQLAPAVADSSINHLVQPSETVYSLSKRYDVTAEAIQAANGGLPQGLKAGSYVRIPAKPKAIVELEPVVPVRPAGTPFRVALLLPFSTAANDSVQARSKENKGMYGPTDAAVQFYAGARMALDSLERIGLKAEVDVFDVGEEAASWNAVLKDPDLRDLDLAIGPFHRGAIDRLSRAAPQAHIVCPVPQSNKVLLGNANVSKVLSGRPDQVQQLARFIAYHHANDNVILCGPDLASEKDLRAQLRTTLERALQQRPSRLRDTIRVARAGKAGFADVISLLSASQKNVVIAATEDVEYATTILAKLSDLLPGKKISLYGLNSWTEMNTLPIDQLEALGTRVPASTWVDRTEPRVVRFIERYRELYENEPGEYAFLGYDVAMYYLTALMRYGRDLPAHFNDVAVQPLHIAFKYVKAGDENGYRNENAVMLEYGPEGLKKVP